MTCNPKLPQDLLGLRQSIDRLDMALLYILSERIRLTKAISLIKAKHNLSSTDKLRELQKITQIRNFALEIGYNPDILEQIFRILFKEAVSHHQKIALNEQSH